MPDPSPVLAVLAGRTLVDGALAADRAVVIAGDRIVAVVAPGGLPPAAERIDLGPGSILAPGFIDWQVNGGGGVLLNDAPTVDGLARIAAAHRRFGTTRLLPTLITDAPAAMDRLLETVGSPVAGVAGLHLEGPFINVERKGVHRADFVRAMQPADIERLAAFAGAGRSVVTLAPETVPAGAIAALAAAGLTVSIGHSQAGAAAVRRAADEGARAVTHLFNAMAQLTPREPGVVGAALDDGRLFAGLIVDGHHVAPENVRIAFRLMGPERLTLVTDAMPLVGTAVRGFDLMGRPVRLDGDRLTTADGTLAGAHLTMIEAVRRTVACGIPLPAALAMASATPARLLGLADGLGTIRASATADLVAFTEDFRVLATWRDGIVERPELSAP